MDWLWTLMAHGGFKLVIVAVIAVSQIVKRFSKKGVAVPQTRTNNEGFSAPGFKTPKQNNSSLGSPWSGGDAFNDINK
ncbi:hypothetical protein EON80_28380 [bacterium]|nr:MAG: hypothetical protein EON80_28380 [bacterium]